jgi:hypothetical protein
MLKLTDTGNDLVFNEKMKSIDYARFSEMRILMEMAEVENVNPNKFTYSIYKQELVTEV